MPSKTKPRNVIYRDAFPDPHDPGMWRIPGVPVFTRIPSGTKTDDEITGDDLRRYAAKNNERAAIGHFRALHHGHQKLRDDGTPDLNGDQPLLSFIEDWEVREMTWGPVLHVTLWGVDDYTLTQFEHGRFSFISVEADPDDIVSIAAMQSRPPFIEFPNLFVRRVSAGDSDSSVLQMAHGNVSRRLQFAKSYPGRRLVQMGDQKRDKGGRFSPPMPGDKRAAKLKEAGTSPGMEGIQHKAVPKKKKSLLKRVAGMFSDDTEEVEQFMPHEKDKGEDMPPMPFADDDGDEEDEDTEQFADDGAAPAAPPDAAGPPAEGGNGDMEIMAILQQILAAVAPAPAAAPAAPAAPPMAPAAPQYGAVPDATRPLEPASNAQFAAGQAPTQFARIHPDDRKILENVQQYAHADAANKELRSLKSQVRAAGADPKEVEMVEVQYGETPKAAQMYAAHLVARGPIARGVAPMMTAVPAPAVNVVGDAIKQFAGDGANVNDPAMRRVANKARQDWIDTTDDDGNDGKAMRLQFAGDAGCQKWISLRLQEHANRQRRQFA